MNKRAQIEKSLRFIYKDEALAVKLADDIERQFSKYLKDTMKGVELSEKDSVLITYGDTLQDGKRPPLQVMATFLKEYVGDAVDAVHLLPMYPYTSDDGFSVTDYREINPDLGTWNDIDKLRDSYHLMFDAVINHISKSSEWFQKYLKCEQPYKDYFITTDPDTDYSTVIRPRTQPLLTPFKTAEGIKHVWTTFSEDQIDLNFKNPDVLIEVIDILLAYSHSGAKFIRLDAIGFMWKEDGTSCMHLPETHEIIKLCKTILDVYAPGTFLITETNVPHKDNISYFGDGTDEAKLVYQFPLPPLVMYSLLKGNAEALARWADALELPSKEVTFFNFLSSHDGIGVRPVEGILSGKEIQFLADSALKHGGEISYKDNGDGTRSPYELNINYQDALAGPDESDDIRIRRFLAAQTILLSMQGVPGIYIHSLLGSRNDYYGKTVSGIARRINREKLDINILTAQLRKNTNRKKIFDEVIRRLNIRKQYSGFAPSSGQEIVMEDRRVFYIVRRDFEKNQTIHVLINVSAESVTMPLKCKRGVDLLTDTQVMEQIVLDELAAVWILEEQ